MSLVQYESSDNESEGSNEEDMIPERKPVAEVLVNKQRGTVKISIPSLQQFQDVDSTPEIAKKPITKSGSGLFTLLPPPKHSTPSDKQSSFVPYVLTKQKEKSKYPIKPAEPALQKTSRVEQLDGIPLIVPDIKEDSDSDTDDTPAADQSSSSQPTIDYFSLERSSHPEFDAKNEDVSIKDIPLFSSLPKPSHTSSVQNVPPTQTHLLVPLSTTSQASQSSNSPTQSTWINNTEERDWESNVSCQDAYAEGTSHLSDQTSSQSTFMEDKRFKRLKARGAMEDVDIIDVNADDQLVGKDKWLMQSLTEEKVQRPSKRRHDMPTQQQKRKHQITYLAYQAKERELDLKNQWALNSRTRRETQAKYGF